MLCSGTFNFLHSRPIIIDLKILHLSVCDLCNINRTRSIKELGDLLKRCVSSLNEEEVDDEDFKEEEHAVENIVFPSECFERDGVDILIEEERGGDAEVQPCESFGADTIGQDFGRVRSQKTRS